MKEGKNKKEKINKGSFMVEGFLVLYVYSMVVTLQVLVSMSVRNHWAEESQDSSTPKINASKVTGTKSQDQELTQ